MYYFAIFYISLILNYFTYLYIYDKKISYTGDLEFCSICGKKKKEGKTVLYRSSAVHGAAYSDNEEWSNILPDSAQWWKTELNSADENTVSYPLVVEFLVDLMMQASTGNTELYKQFNDFLTKNGAAFKSDAIQQDLSQDGVVQTNMIIAGKQHKWNEEFKRNT